MIDPTHSLAFSVQSNPGVYAVLIGSGVSRQAEILTGWEITCDLIRKLAASCGEDCAPDPERWYIEKYKNIRTTPRLLKSWLKRQLRGSGF